MRPIAACTGPSAGTPSRALGQPGLARPPGPRLSPAGNPEATARTRAEQLREVELATMRALVESATEAEAVPRLLAEIGDGLGWEIALHWVVDDESGRLQCTGRWSAAKVEAEHVEAMNRLLDLLSGEDRPGRILSERTAAWVEDVTAVEAQAQSAGLCSALGVPVAHGNRVLGVLELFSRQRRLADPHELELVTALAGHIARFLERSRLEARAERFKDEVLALVSHELRTPLTCIAWHVELLEGQKGLSDEARGYVSILDRNARRLQRLAGDLLLSAQVEAQTLGLDRGRVELAALTREAVDSVRPALRRDAIELALTLGDPPPIHADRDRIAQVLDILLSNAVKFTPRGGEIAIRVAPAGNGALVEVADSGVGIPVAEQGRLFQRFFRASTAQHLPGVGVGLSIARTIVEAHDGQITLTSAEGRGTTVHVALPGLTPVSPGPGSRAFAPPGASR